MQFKVYLELGHKFSPLDVLGSGKGVAVRDEGKRLQSLISSAGKNLTLSFAIRLKEGWATGGD